MLRLLLSVLITMSTLLAPAQTKILLSAGDSSMTATLADNDATRTLLSLLKSGPVTVKMDDYGGFEKVGSLPQALPISNSQITTSPGDIMLYQGSSIVIFYGSNTWSYTPLGKIDGATADNLRQWLGRGSITVTLSLHSSSGLPTVSASDPDIPDAIYDLSGKRITRRLPSPGVYIINGRKTLLRP